jgi:hypothetical protein
VRLPSALGYDLGDRDTPGPPQQRDDHGLLRLARLAAAGLRSGLGLVSGRRSVDTGTGLCEGSLRRFLHESIKNGSGAQGNHCHRKTRNDENAHDLSPAATANSTHLS